VALRHDAYVPRQRGVSSGCYPDGVTFFDDVEWMAPLADRALGHAPSLLALASCRHHPAGE
jgi:hypothetical protein